MLLRGYTILLFLALACATVGSCQSSRPSSGAAPRYEVTTFTRKDPTQAPILLGHIEQRESTGTYPLGGSMVVVDREPIFSDSTGNYQREVKPGTPRIAAKGIGLESILVKRLRLRQGDSIRIDFQMQSDKVPLHLQK